MLALLMLSYSIGASYAGAFIVCRTGKNKHTWFYVFLLGQIFAFLGTVLLPRTCQDLRTRDRIYLASLGLGQLALVLLFIRIIGDDSWGGSVAFDLLGFVRHHFLQMWLVLIMMAQTYCAYVTAGVMVGYGKSFNTWFLIGLVWLGGFVVPYVLWFSPYRDKISVGDRRKLVSSLWPLGLMLLLPMAVALVLS